MGTRIRMAVRTAAAVAVRLASATGLTLSCGWGAMNRIQRYEVSWLYPIRYRPDYHTTKVMPRFAR